MGDMKLVNQVELYKMKRATADAAPSYPKRAPFGITGASYWRHSMHSEKVKMTVNSLNQNGASSDKDIVTAPQPNK